MSKRPTTDFNPLDSLFQAAQEIKESSPPSTKREEVTAQKKQKPSAKQRITVQISEEVIERIKNAVYWTPGLTIASLVEESLSKAVDKLEQERKAPFPQRKEELKSGRPIS